MATMQAMPNAAPLVSQSQVALARRAICGQLFEREAKLCLCGCVPDMRVSFELLETGCLSDLMSGVAGSVLEEYCWPVVGLLSVSDRLPSGAFDMLLARVEELHVCDTVSWD